MQPPLHVRIRRESGYDIRFGLRLREIAGALARRPLGRLHIVVTDTNVARLHGRGFVARLKRHVDAHLLVVPAGERSKSRPMKERLEDRMLALGAHRDAVVVALGGGMIGDLAGFTAATLHRGVPLVQIPTTLLAQVDSSVGGKVAVDHPRGKNLIGVFCQPDCVYIDVALLRTLQRADFRSGMAEVIKYGATMDAGLFRLLGLRPIDARNTALMARIVRRCCDLKRRIVQADEREAGIRRILNFGHTVGHAVEMLAGYRMRHGEAVAIGMCAEAWMGVQLGITPRDAARRLEELVRRQGLPVSIPRRFGAGEVARGTRLDKKTLGGTVRYTLLTGIGAARTGVAIPERDVITLLRSVRKP